MSAQTWPRSAKAWRFAAVLTLLTGAGTALAYDPALLDRAEVKFPLVGLFVLLWMVPFLQSRRAEKAAKKAASPDWHEPDAKSGRAVFDTLMGLVSGVVLGALVLSFPGVVDVLTSGPTFVGQAFDRMEGFNPFLVVVLALSAFAFLSACLRLLMHSVRASRVIGGVVMGLCLWLPFANHFEAALARIGVTLPGLHSAAMKP
jgi:hypothetical protein